MRRKVVRKTFLTRIYRKSDASPAGLGKCGPQLSDGRIGLDPKRHFAFVIPHNDAKPVGALRHALPVAPATHLLSNRLEWHV